MSLISGSRFVLTWGLFAALAAATMTTTTSTTAASSTTTTTSSSTGFLATTITTMGTSTTTTITVKGPRFVATNFVKYVGSDTNFNVNGSVYFEQISSESGVPGQSLTWDLGDLDPACKTGSGNQCGIHIHVGTNCSEDAEGEFWNETLVDTNPWTAVQYNTNDELLSQSDHGIKVITGMESEDIVGHAVIVYDSVAPGNRIACALITEAYPTTTTTTTTSTSLPSETSWGLLVAVLGLLVCIIIVAGTMFCTNKPKVQV